LIRAPRAATPSRCATNLANDNVRGYDFTQRYVRDIGPGTLRATTEITHFLEQSSKLFSDDPLDDFNGTINNPSTRAR
jgi:hypothetical protein